MKNKTNILVGLNLALALFLTSCSLRNPNSANYSTITIALPNKPSGKKQLSNKNASQKGKFAAPTALSDFNCFAVNVSGPEIPLHENVNCSGSQSVGIVGGFVSSANGSIDITVPSGPQRNFEVIGIQSSNGCPNFDSVIGGNYSGIGAPYIVGSTTEDVLNNSTVVVTVNFNAATANRAFSGCSIFSQPSNLFYDSYSPTIYSNNLMAPMFPSIVGGGSGTTFSISPTLPSGLTINSNSGTISGTPTIQGGMANTTFTITASNNLGSTSTTINLGVDWGWTWSWTEAINNVNGTFGTQGVPTSSNFPPALGETPGVFHDSSGNLWLFGGFGYNGTYNTLWKFDGTNWTWISGSQTVDLGGVYNSQGVTVSTSYPGSRSGSALWMDSHGNIWLFGGNGYDSTGAQGDLNDLWKFNGTNWTWVAGSNVVNGTVTFGTLGVSSASNTPPPLDSMSSWIDSSDNLWFFGGENTQSGIVTYNSLWKFSTTSGQWAWMGGASTSGSGGNYGTQGTVSSTNEPSARRSMTEVADSSGNIWIFGGLDNNGYALNDLWKFDGANWTWMSGENGDNGPGTYGSLGTPSSTDLPSSRYGAFGWIDSTTNNNIFIFGGSGAGDLWQYSIASNQWTWLSGNIPSSGVNPVYGILGVQGPLNTPFNNGTAAWTDSNGTHWLLGGGPPSPPNGVGLAYNVWKF